MLAAQRQAEILRDLQSEGAVSVVGLARRFAVADETIRRDLAKLAELGRAVRTHGGAVLADAPEPPFALRRDANAHAKRAIGRWAAGLVLPGDVIAIDASTTGLELARALTNEETAAPITVVSNGLDLVRTLADRPGIRVVCTGGEYDPAGECFVGPLAESALRQFALRHAFVSCRALDPTRGASETCLSHASIKRLMLDVAEASHLLIDSSKVGHASACFYAPTEAFQTIVSDSALDESRQEGLQNLKLVKTTGETHPTNEI